MDDLLRARLKAFEHISQCFRCSRAYRALYKDVLNAGGVLWQDGFSSDHHGGFEGPTSSEEAISAFFNTVVDEVRKCPDWPPEARFI